MNAAQIIQKVEAARASGRVSRGRLGLSEVGHKCQRWLRYRHDKAESTPPSGRMIRLWRLGDSVEVIAKEDLALIGYEVIRDQEEVVVDISDDIQLTGHIDGVVTIDDESHLFECKSASDKRFKELVKLGSYEKWDQKYKAQIHVYMLLLGLELCLVWVENKNTSELYAEIIDLDDEYAIRTLENVKMALESPELPERSCPSASWYEAKFCEYCSICFE